MLIRQVLGSEYAAHVHQTIGTISGVEIRASIFWAANERSFYPAYSEAKAIADTRDYWSALRSASDLGPPVGMGAVTYAFFTHGATDPGMEKNCVAFDVAGPAKVVRGVSGYAWRMHAFSCRPYGPTADVGFLTAVLSSIRVGPPSDNMSALGHQVRASPALPE